MHQVHNNVVAVKKLSVYNQEVFNRELIVLRNLRKREHIHHHLTTLLGSYEQDDHLHLILPWAECDLGHFWKSKYSNGPERSRERSSWLKQQCCGMAEAVSHLHRYHTSSATTMLESNNLGQQTKRGRHSRPPSGERNNLSLFGRHGDIKPANILWFPDQSNPAAFGTLKISDFGTARFSTNEDAVAEDKTTVPNSRAYQSPECVLPNGNISSQCDVWSLGCVFLEFVCWYFGGRDLLITFEQDRRHPYGDSTFFSIVRHETPRSTLAELKQPVIEVSHSVPIIVDGQLRSTVDDRKITARQRVQRRPETRAENCQARNARDIESRRPSQGYGSREAGSKTG
jgi:serine/threonine protein kinase